MLGQRKPPGRSHRSAKPKPCPSVRAILNPSDRPKACGRRLVVRRGLPALQRVQEHFGTSRATVNLPPHPPRYRHLSPTERSSHHFRALRVLCLLRSSALQPLHTFALGSLQVCTEGSCCPQHQAPRLVRRQTRRSWWSRSPESARHGAWLGLPAKSVPVGPRLTRRCSGLTSFAAELHFVRPRPKS